MLVILNHSISLQTHDKLLFCVWGEIAVPMFLFIKVFHLYRHKSSTIHSHDKMEVMSLDVLFLYCQFLYHRFVPLLLPIK